MLVGIESHRRSIVKALTWRVIATLVTTLVVYSFTREVVLAMGIGFVDAAIKMVAYYLHERLWNRINFGIKKEVKEDYMI
ncbi:DUF2061 domain-containing protein [Candidatus Pacearchaeota archaeon]|jgi:uncharacterized membrane protein|nr:DUF2061 domain-containing protein [Candidatus Pacearchaeota archaeon]